MRKRIGILAVIVIALIIGYSYINQSHRDIEHENAEFNVNAIEIASNFSENTSLAETKYLNTTIEVNGNITEVNSNSITLNDKVFCQFTKAIETTLKSNTTVKIKGRVIGYDDLLEQVKLDQCTIN
ncbi:OB-fold protein [Psychroserpens mesophilus]|uniref:OB-fold protein n=1 Tax=Psychroserpens mesophilus TaxID=325473 RepID=UPI003F496AD0